MLVPNKNTKGKLQTWRWYIAYKVHRLEFADMLRNFVYKGNWCKLANCCCANRNN